MSYLDKCHLLTNAFTSLQQKYECSTMNRFIYKALKIKKRHVKYYN